MPLIRRRKEITISDLLLGDLNQSCASLTTALKAGSVATGASHGRSQPRGSQPGFSGAEGELQKALSALSHQVSYTKVGPLIGKE